jgi:hypothetical protein
MPPWKLIGIILLAVAYSSATYGIAPRAVVPAVGSGVPAIQKATGKHQEAPRPSWVPRRHLPLVKIYSFDQLLSIGRDLVSPHDLSGLHMLPQVSTFCEDDTGSPSSVRAPPIR